MPTQEEKMGLGPVTRGPAWSTEGETGDEIERFDSIDGDNMECVDPEDPDCQTTLAPITGEGWRRMIKRRKATT
jgi:hypothetical protein